MPDVGIAHLEIPTHIYTAELLFIPAPYPVRQLFRPESQSYYICPKIYCFRFLQSIKEILRPVCCGSYQEAVICKVPMALDRANIRLQTVRSVPEYDAMGQSTGSLDSAVKIGLLFFLLKLKYKFLLRDLVRALH